MLKLLESLDAFRRPERLDKFLLACEADARGRKGLEDRNYPQNSYLKSILAAANGIDNQAAISASNAEPRIAIQEARLQAISDSIESLRHDQ